MAVAEIICSSIFIIVAGIITGDPELRAGRLIRSDLTVSKLRTEINTAMGR